MLFENRSSQSRLALFPGAVGTGFGSGAGLGWGFTASRYSTETLEATNHDFELAEEADRRIHVHVDSHSMGVGGYDSWSPNVDKEFLIPSDKQKGKELEVDLTLLCFSIQE